METSISELIKTDKYKKSKYKVVKLNGFYAISVKETKFFVDIKSIGYHQWDVSREYYEDCISDKEEIILKKFEMLLPEVQQFVIESIEGSKLDTSCKDHYKQKFLLL